MHSHHQKYFKRVTMTWVNGDTMSIKILLCCTARNTFVSARIFLLLLGFKQKVPK